MSGHVFTPHCSSDRCRKTMAIVDHRTEDDIRGGPPTLGKRHGDVRACTGHYTGHVADPQNPRAVTGPTRADRGRRKPRRAGRRDRNASHPPQILEVSRRPLARLHPVLWMRTADLCHFVHQIDKRVVLALRFIKRSPTFSGPQQCEQNIARCSCAQCSAFYGRRRAGLAGGLRLGLNRSDGIPVRVHCVLAPFIGTALRNCEESAWVTAFCFPYIGETSYQQAVRTFYTQRSSLGRSTSGRSQSGRRATAKSLQ